MDSGNGAAPADTAVLPRRARGRGMAALILFTAVIAALGGLTGGVVVGWWVGRQAVAARPATVATPTPVPTAPAASALAPATPPVVTAEPSVLAPASPPRAVRPRHPASAHGRKSGVAPADVDWWSGLVNDNPYR